VPYIREYPLADISYWQAQGAAWEHSTAKTDPKLLNASRA
jgi:hypothetical protein